MKNTRGFTLIEVMVTIIVVGITTAALSSMFISIRNIQLQSSYYDTAHRAAVRQVEKLRNDSYASLTAGQAIDFTTDIPSTLPSRNGSAVISAPSADLRRVDATVTYKIQGTTRTVVISSLIGEIGITQ